MIALTLPLPPNANHYLRHTRTGRVYKTDEARRYRQTVEACTRGLTPIDKGELAVHLAVYRGNDANGKLRRGDLDGYQKVLLDSLQGRAYRNDSQIRRLEAHLHEDRVNPRVEVRIEVLR